ncbi:unnamed protein product [Penicillium nalgiovense]|uniref:Nuclear RNA binding protein n=1 Tax=Penicillium nalgiovense TaxID=60175 RepID=A0A9W4MZV0_PENNA|nr:unnamed protein product [Penicillium nalgiovense]CAG7977636.1 unnamed protein product [Penicillium nalgiovense]CAG7979627.1 unnamed protein product [Penicillium nalgiovense]CAG7989765.1 unnamed protein product [Penicillium nalgiovense]CAG8070895.1 unnamed protein product [Penicillium nalgiovense]
MEMDIDPSPAHQRTSRKHLRSSDDEDCGWSSDTSGQFDDADEVHPDDHRSPAGNLAKRRRSNDWPLPEEAADYGAHDRRAQRGENGNLSVGGNGSGYKSSPRASPRGSLASLRARHAAASASNSRRPRGRTSRFVEATMNDSVSEKPPSIYFQEENKQPGIQHRSSGIFRFGKAIASAFNPFGGWGKNSEGSPVKSPQKDVINQAEQAYAELKKAGYKGTNKGHYTEGLGVNTTAADQTLRSIQHKMEYGSPVKGSPVKGPYRHSIDQENHGAPLRSESSASKRSSLQDLRLTKSFFKSHGSPSASPAVFCDRTSDEYEQTGLRKRPSRRELSRQTKLLKKVSNLEDKLQRARRELHELTGNEERIPEPMTQPNTINTEMDPALFPRKFVPGALPTLPSERLLDQQAAENEASGSEAANLTALPSVESRETFSFEESRPPQTPATSQSPKWRSKGTQPSSMGKDRSSRKRKSSIPESIASGNPLQPSPTKGIDDQERDPELDVLIDSGLLSPPGKAKWPKSEAGESPGSAKRKQATDHAAPPSEHEMKDAGGSTSATRNTKRSPYVQPRKVSGTTRSPSSKPTTPTRMKKSQTNMRPASSPAAASDDDSRSNIWSTPLPAPPSNSHREAFYYHPQGQLNPDRSPRTPTRSKTSPSRRRSGYLRDDDIPPVPPLPEEHRSSAAKVKVDVNRSPKKRPVSAPVLSPSSASVVDSVISGLEDYQWPEDIF